MNAKKVFPYIILAILAIIALALRNCNTSINKPNNNTGTAGIAADKRGLNRNPSNINYSKHARCRMEARRMEAPVVCINRAGIAPTELRALVFLLAITTEK